MWTVVADQYGAVDEISVPGATLSEAVVIALETLGIDMNDEGTVTLEVSGAAGDE